MFIDLKKIDLARARVGINCVLFLKDKMCDRSGNVLNLMQNDF